MKQATNSKLLAIAGSLLLGVAVHAQSTAPAQSAAPVAEPNYGLLGSNYVGLGYGYNHLDQAGGPSDAHSYDAVYNQSIEPGLDFTGSFDDLRMGYRGANLREDQLLAGVTGYAPVTPWLKAFVSAQAGVAWTQSADFHVGSFTTDHGNYLDTLYTAGAQFQVLPAMVVSPYVSYQDVNHLGNVWSYGVKATYRLCRNWSVSLTPSIDQYHDLSYEGGINYHF